MILKSAEWDKHADEINELLAAKMLVTHAKELFENDYFEKLREREQLALMIFLDVMQVETSKVIPRTTA